LSRFTSIAGLLAFSLFVMSDAAAQAVKTEAYVAPRNGIGQPDLTGLWTNATATGLERPARYGERLVIPAEEAGRPGGDPGASAMNVNGELRSSFLVEPKDGQLPALTPEAVATREARRAALGSRGPGYARGDNPESLTPAERCLKDFGSSSGPPMMPVGYNNTYEIVQTPGHVMILVEMIHDVRIIPLTRDRSRSTAIRQWMGDSIGWYDGDTLVVETTNFRPGQGFRGMPDDAKLVERFKRVNDKQILYSFEVNEPRAFTAPMKAEIAMNATDGPLYEYACHEANYSMANILSGNRAMDEKNAAAMAEAAKKRAKAPRGGN